MTGYVGNTSALRMKKSPSMETNTGLEIKGTALREENVADLLAERNEQWGDEANTNVASHGQQDTAKGKKESSAGEVDDARAIVVDEDKGVENVPEDTTRAEKTNLDDSFEDWNGAELRTCGDLVYKMTLNNTLDEAILFKIKLSPVSTANIPNLRWPVNGIRGRLAAN